MKSKSCLPPTISLFFASFASFADVRFSPLCKVIP